MVFCSRSRNTPFAKQNNIASVPYSFILFLSFFSPLIGSCFSRSHL